MEFNDRFVAFLDILGFKEILKRDNQEVERIMHIISDVTQDVTTVSGHGIIPDDNITQTVLSDSIVLSIPAPGIIKDAYKNFRFLLHVVEKIQFKCALEDVWIRGGISWGNLHHELSGGNVIGQGLVNAYLFEQTAHYPRVLIDPSIIPDYFGKLGCSATRSAFISEINMTWGASVYSGKFIFDKSKIQAAFHGYFQDDMPLFVHYFNSIYEEKTPESARTKISDLLKSRLYSSKETAIYAKYKWVVDYLLTIAPEDINVEQGFFHDLCLL